MLMAYVSSGGNVAAKRSIFRLSIFSDIFWGIVNFIWFFFQSMFMSEEDIRSTKYYKPSSSSATYGGGGGPGKSVSQHCCPLHHWPWLWSPGCTVPVVAHWQCQQPPMKCKYVNGLYSPVCYVCFCLFVRLYFRWRRRRWSRMAWG